MVDRNKEILKICENSLYGHYPPNLSMKKIFQELLEYVNEDEYGDNYGKGEYITKFEKQIADLLGKESAVFMPSGTMAQQIALRIWCEKNKNRIQLSVNRATVIEYAETESYVFPVFHYLKQCFIMKSTANSSINLDFITMFTGQHLNI